MEASINKQPTANPSQQELFLSFSAAPGFHFDGGTNRSALVHPKLI